MAYSNGIITAPVGEGSKFTDVNAALGTQADNVRSLCRSLNINMWAKFKPVPCNQKGEIINAQLNANKTWKRDDELLPDQKPWWQGNDNNYGLTFTAYSINTGRTGVDDALNLLAADIDGQANGWEHHRPSGTANEPYRLSDFNGYNARAPRPIQNFTCSPHEVQGADLSTWEISAQFIQTDPSIPIGTRDYLTPTDITGYTIYTGIAIFKKLLDDSYRAIAWCTGNAWEGNGIKSADVLDGITGRGDTEVQTTFSGSHTYYVLPVLFTCELIQSGPGFSSLPTSAIHKVIPVPYTTFDSFDTVHAATTQRIGKPVASSRQIIFAPNLSRGAYSGDISLDSTGSYYLGTQGSTTTVTVGLVVSTWTSGTPAQGDYVFWQSFSGVTVGADEVKLICHIFSNNIDLTRTWKLVVIVDGEKSEIGLIQPPQPSTD